MRIALVLASFALSTASLASEWPFLEAACGDDAFKVDGTIDPSSEDGTLTLSGTSLAAGQTHFATVTDNGRIVFTTASGDRLEIDDSDAVHDLFFGYWISRDRATYLGLCGVR